MRGTCVYVNIHILVTHNTMQYTPSSSLKKKSELWKENFVLLKHIFGGQIDALLFHFLAEHQQKQSPLAPKVWNPSPLHSLPYVSKGNFEDCECRFHWSPFRLPSPMLKPLIDFAKDWSIPRSENEFLVVFFLSFSFF